MATYLWSDTHFGHHAIIGYCQRTWAADVEDMNRQLVYRWNAAVKPKDAIYLLGDFGFGAMPTLAAIFDQLHGHKHLIAGNHDERNRHTLRLPWESVDRLRTLREEGIRAELCHYPIESWKDAHKGALMLHGHSHGSLRRKMPHRFDVGVEVYPRPVLLQDLAALARAQDFEPADHHGDL